MKVDLTTVEVIKGALIYAAEEMGIALKKSAYSPNIKERMDHSCALFNHRRELIAQAEHIPVHLGSMAMAVRVGLEVYKGTLEPGDMLLLNDPYISGTHLPDLTMIAPIFSEGSIIGYAANKAHHTDIGGKAPGSLAADSTELYQEGLVIPPVKLVRKGVLDSDLSNLIRSNVRTPLVQMGDIRAQIAANNTGIKRVDELVEQYGAETLHQAMDDVMDYSERRMREEISAMPDGVYSAVDYMESILPGDGDVSITVTITKNGDSMVFDYSGTSDMVDRPVNAPLGVTVAGIYFTLISTTDPTIPVNDGCFRPITLKVPEGCMMNPIRPAPVAGGNVETSQRNVDVIMKAFSQIIPDKVPAASQGTMNNITIGGTMRDGTPWTFYETIAGGNGGRPTSDGVDGVHTNMTNTMNTPIETLEAYLPFKFKAYRLRPDSGGPGKFRGGCGIERTWTLTSPKAVLGIMAERNKIPPWGLQDGKPGGKGKFTLIRANGDTERLPSKCTMEIHEGDTLVILTPGGGGFGDPKERDPEHVRRDVENGLVSKESALDDYGVEIDPSSYEIIGVKRK
ncbi:MAG: hydantoinase B/oxoprolinase family protein [Candidatus Bathyarchaeota archaeon]|nr:hydantoinase B/oxoprolinase family protein [Candidatus Bathyarchaeota archaeon]